MGKSILHIVYLIWTTKSLIDSQHQWIDVSRNRDESILNNIHIFLACIKI